MKTYLSLVIRHIWNVVGLSFVFYYIPSWMNLAAIGIPHYIRQQRHDSVAGIRYVLFYLPEDSGYVNPKHDVTKTEIESILRERDVVVEREIKTNRCDVELGEFFSYVVQNENEGLSLPPRSWREEKRNFEKIMALCS